MKKIENRKRNIQCVPKYHVTIEGDDCTADFEKQQMSNSVHLKDKG